MKIAVTYEGGSIFQHFGKTETFKMYEVEDGKITSMQIVHAGGAGHGVYHPGPALDGGIGGDDRALVPGVPRRRRKNAIGTGERSPGRNRSSGKGSGTPRGRVGAWRSALPEAGHGLRSLALPCR